MLGDMVASYLDLGSVIDSKEGGLEESEEVEGRQVKEVRSHILVGHSSPNISAKFQATAGVLPLGRDPFDDIES